MPVTVVAGAVALGISEFMTTFEFTPPGGEPLQEQLAGDRHGYAMLLLAAFAVTSTLASLSPPANEPRPSPPRGSAWRR